MLGKFRSILAAFPMAQHIGILLLAAGCGDGAVPLYEVTGTVLYRGKPAVGALVVFHNTRPPDRIHDMPIPRGHTDAKGHFSLSCHEPGDGAPAGQYAVTVMLSSVTPAELASPEAANETSDPEAGGVVIAADGRQYLDPATSGLIATVREEANVLPPFELQ